MNSIKNGFGECLKKIRRAKKYTQELLAEKLEINLRQLARIEAGESFVTAETLLKICLVFEISPWELFNFKIEEEEECLNTGTGDIVYFKAVKSGNVIKLTTDKNVNKIQKQEILLNDVDKKMLNMAKNIGKNVNVDEISNGIVISKKIYTPDGTIKTQKLATNNNDLYQDIKNKIQKISENQSKLNFINLAIESFNNKKSREKLKNLIDGMNLIE